MNATTEAARNNAEGRALADKIDMELNGVAKKLEAEQQPGGR